MNTESQFAPGARRHTVAAAAVLTLAIAGCGGSDDGGGTPVNATPAAATTAVSVTVIDGAITGATVCLDKNRNGLCDDTGEPRATTAAGGVATLTVDNADVGKYPVVAMIGTTAVDADNGAVPTAYILQAPADKPALVSPLTTLVKLRQDDTGASSTDAAAQIKAETGLAASPLDNYLATRSTDANAVAAAALARLVVLATQAQVTALASTVGQADVSGATISATDVQAASIKALLGALPSLGAAATAAGVTATSTPAAVDTALSARLAPLVEARQVGLTTADVAAAVGTAKLPTETTAAPATPVATANLSRFNFTDVNNWFLRTYQSTVADNTVDADGNVHWYDTRTQNVAGTKTSWGFGATAARQGDLHWNGSAWTGCPLNFRHSQKPRDTNGRTTYNYCDGLEFGTSQRAAVDIAGQTLSGVVATVRAFPNSDTASFGPTNLGLLGTATFPTGSTLYYYSTVFNAWAYAYDVQTSAIVSGFTAELRPGGDGTVAGSACANITPANTASFLVPLATLEALVAANPGTPCVYGLTTATPQVANEWWGNSTVGMGTLAGAAQPPNAYFNTTRQYRVAFVPTGNVARYLSCLVRASDNGNARNCTEIGRGTYAVQTLGDARVMTLANLPADALRLGYARVFVERGGKVYAGYQTLGGTAKTVRLNLTAANALLTQLGVPTLNPQ